MKELEEKLRARESNEFPRRPSSELSKLETVREWEEFKKETKAWKAKLKDMDFRIFIIQCSSSFMPINEPDSGNNTILLTVAMTIKIQLYGASGNLPGIIFILLKFKEMAQ